MKLLIVSDIHGNWSALQSVLDAEADYDKILCLGDLVDYGPEPAACVAWAMKQNNNAIFIQGEYGRFRQYHFDRLSAARVMQADIASGAK
jgi:predicted phosphodiesterase